MPSHPDDSTLSSSPRFINRLRRSLNSFAVNRKVATITPKAMVDALEPRRHLATDFYFAFDFTQTVKTAAGGYIADIGKKYSRQPEAKFGWDTDNSAHTRNRRTDEILRYDTIAFMGIGNSATKWELGVQPGLYEVGVVAGDAKYADGKYAIKVEGATVINQTPTQDKKFSKGYVQVWVSDGRITLTSGITAVGNKLVSVTVRKLETSTVESASNGASKPAMPANPSTPTTPTNPTPASPATPTTTTPASGGANTGSGSNTGGNTAPDIVNHSAVAGIVNNEMPVEQAIPIMKALGMKSVRIWYGINSWTQGVDEADIRKAQAYKAAGISVTMAFVSKKVGDAGTVKKLFQTLAARADVRAAVDYWEIGNEMNLGSYWNSSLQSYVTNYLKPAYEAIHPYASEKVIGGGVSWDVNAAKQLQTAGYGNYCDYAGFHPYGESGAIVAERIKGAKAAFNNKPMIVTEWNVQFVNDAAKWAREITIAAQALAQTTHLSYYYALRVDGSHVGKGGAVYANGAKNTLFYDALKSWTS